MAAVATGVGSLSPTFEAPAGAGAARAGQLLLCAVCQGLFCLCSAGALAIVALALEGGALPAPALVTSVVPAALAAAVVALILNQGAAALRRFQAAPA